MATISPAPVARRAALEASDRFVLKGVPWELYERLRDLPENSGVRMAYDSGELEFMAPSQYHGEIEFRFGLFLMELAEAIGFKCKGLANTTWKKAGALKAKEADGCFYLANYERVRGKEIDLNVDPPPDLAIEVEVSRSALDAPGIYEAIGVPEIWRFDGSTLHIHRRQVDGSYQEVNQSFAIPCLEPAEVVAWMIRAEEADDDVEWKQEVRAWARDVLLPRAGPGWRPGRAGA